MEAEYKEICHYQVTSRAGHDEDVWISLYFPLGQHRMFVLVFSDQPKNVAASREVDPDFPDNPPIWFLYYPMSKLPFVLDLLRNESPVRVGVIRQKEQPTDGLREPAIWGLQTMVEPVGGGEAKNEEKEDPSVGTPQPLWGRHLGPQM